MSKNRNLLSRFLLDVPFVKGSAVPSIAIFGQEGINCIIQSGPPILGVFADLVDLHACFSGFLADCLVVVEHHLDIPTLANPHLPTFTCPLTDNRAVVHKVLGLKPLTLVLDPLALEVASKADHPDPNAHILHPLEPCSLPLQLMALYGLEPVHTDPLGQFLSTRNWCHGWSGCPFGKGFLFSSFCPFVKGFLFSSFCPFVKGFLLLCFLLLCLFLTSSL